jgi:hypothetical protein
VAHCWCKPSAAMATGVNTVQIRMTHLCDEGKKGKTRWKGVVLAPTVSRQARIRCNTGISGAISALLPRTWLSILVFIESFFLFERYWPLG